jgi:hypothetical protein
MAKNWWEDAPEVSSGSKADWWSEAPLLDDGKKELPSGVNPSTAGAVRGYIQPPKDGAQPEQNAKTEVAKIASGLKVPESVVDSAIKRANDETLAWATANPKSRDKASGLFQGKLQQYLEEGQLRHQLDTSGFWDTAKGMTLKDPVAMLGSGTSSLLSGAGELFGSDALKNAGARGSETYNDLYSDAMLNELSPTAGVTKSVGESLPGTVAGMALGAGVGGLAAKAASPLLGAAASSATAVPSGVGSLLKIAAAHAAPQIAGAALGEGGISALSGAQQAAQEFDAAIKENRAAVLSTPRAKELLAKNGGDANAALSEMRAEAIDKGALYQGAATTVGGLLVPGIEARAIGKALGSTERITAKGLTDKMLHVGRETGQEFIQGYGEQVGGNIAAQSTFDPTRDTTDGALLNASMSGIAGTAMAGAPEVVVGAYEKTAEVAGLAKKIAFGDPNGPAAQAGITPVTVQLPTGSRGIDAAGVSAGSGVDTGNQPSASVAGVRPVADVVGRVDNTASGDASGGTDTVSNETGAAEQPTAVDPLKRTSDQDLLSRVPKERFPVMELHGAENSGFASKKEAQLQADVSTKQQPGFSWEVEQLDSGRFKVAAYPLQGEANGQNNTVAEPAASERAGDGVRNDDGLPSQGDPASVRGRENLGDAKATAELGSRIGRTLTVITPETVRGLPANSSRARAYRVFNRFAGIANTAFGYKPVAIAGLKQYGVQYDGRAYIDIDEMSDGKGEGVAGMVLLTMGHEVGHAMQKSADPDDRAAYQGFRNVVVKYANAGVIDRRQRFEDSSAIAEGGKAQGKDYATDEVVNDVNGAMWRDSKFWGMLYDLDSGSTMRRIAYKFMQAATKVIGAAKKNGYNDIESLVGKNIEVVREAAAKAWADRAMRKGKDFKARPALKAELFDTDPAFSRKGVVGEVAPHPGEDYTGDVYGVDVPVPRNILNERQKINRDRKETAGNWDEMRADEKTMANRDVAKRIFQSIVDARKLNGWNLSFSTGQYLGKTNPNFIIDAPENATWGQLRDVASEIGFVLDQQSMVAFDENDTSGRHENGFVKVILPKDFPASKLQELRDSVKEKFPQADSNTQMKPNELVFGNFTKFGDNELNDADFADGIEAAVKALDWDGDTIDVENPVRYASELIWPDSRLGYLKDQEYGKGQTNNTQPGDGRPVLRSEQGNNLLSLRKLAREAIGRRQDWIDTSTSGRARAGVQQRALADATQSTAKAEREYGTAREGSVAKVGVHFSQQRRKVLSSEFHGSGLKGAERERAQSKEYIKDRLFFYVDSGKGVTPGAGVGSVRHIVKLKNLYDASKDPKGFSRMSTGATEQERQTKFENFVKNAGFDGYFMDKGGNQDFAVLIGRHRIEMPSYSRRYSPDEGNKIDNIDDLGSFNLDRDYAESTKDDFSFPDLSAAEAKLDEAAPTEAEMAERLRAEREDAKKFKKLLARELLEEGFSVVGTPKTASAKETSFTEVKPAEIKSKGLMAEEAYPDLEYATDPIDRAVERAFFVIDGTRYKATVAAGSSPKVQDGAAEKYSKGKAKGFMAGYDLKGLTLKAKKEWNKRFAASADLLRRDFDLYTSVPAKARENVLAIWKTIAANPKAFEFANADGAKGSTVKDVAQDIANKMMASGRYKVKIGSPEYHRGTSDFSIMITDTKTGAEGSADVEFWQKEREVTMHTHELDKGSGLGKPAYQIGQAFADKFNARINADGVLLGVNNYRRTEQMFSGMLRSGNYETMQPGVGQRIYGWNERAKNQDQNDRNMVRTALAMARNVLEFAPKMKDIGFDLAKNSFYFRNKPDSVENRLMAGVEIRRILSDSDVRVASISRSTLARAAITLEAMDGKVDVPNAIAEPVLYKRKDIPENPKLKQWAENLMAGRRDDPGFVVAPEPHKALQMFGVGRSSPVTLQADMIRHLNNKGRSNNGITAADVARIPALLDEPRAVIERVTTNKETGLTKREYAMILDDQNEAGSPMLIALTPAQLKMGQKSVGITDIRTMYGKDESLRYVLQSIADGQRIWMPENEIARVQGFTSEGLIPYGAKGTAPPKSQAIPSNVFGPKALVKSGQGGKDWQLLKEAVRVTPDDVKRAEGLAFKRKQIQRAPGLPGESAFMAARRVLQDSLIHVRELQKFLVSNGGTVNEEQDVYGAEERMHGRTQELLTDFGRNQIEPLIAKAAKMKVNLDELALYAYAKHAPERNAYIESINPKIGDAGSGMSNANAANIIQLVDMAGDKAKFEELHQDLMGVTSTTRRVLLDEGLITQEEYDGWEGLYDNYVPLRGFENVNHDTATTMRGTGKGFSMTGKESMKALGRTSKAGEILENILRDYERAVIRSEKNAVAKTFLDLALTNPDPDLWEVDPVKVNRSFNKASGLVLMSRSPDTGEDTFAIKVAGQQVRVKIKDPLILQAMKATGKDQTGQLQSFIVKSFSWYTNLLRNTLTRYNPIFGALNAVRDSQMGAVSAFDELGAEGLKLYTKYLPVALSASFRQERGVADPANKVMDKWIMEMRFAGGTTGGYHMRDTSEITDTLRTMMLQAGAAPKTKMDYVKASGAYKGAQSVGKWLEIIGSTSEDAARAAAYRAAREMGKTPAQAASIAKNLTTNFNRKGEWGSSINSLYLFFNAGVQGSTRVLEALKNPKVRYMMAGVTATSMAVAMMNAVGGGDDDDGEAYWDKIPDYEKERNLIFMLPAGMEMDGATKIGSRGRYIKIPIPYGINVFPVLGNQLADLARWSKDPARGVKPAKAAINLVSAIFGSINPFGGSMDPTDKHQWALAVLPTAMDTAYQQAFGINGFGRPVGPEKSPFDDKPDSENYSARQAGGTAQRVAHWLNSVTGGNEARSGAIDVMPGTLDNAVRNTTGGLGVFIWDTFVNLPSKMVSPVEPTSRDIPLWRNFYSEIDGITDMGLFYDRRAEVQKEYKEAKAEMKLGIQVDYSDEQINNIALAKISESVTKELSKLRKEEIRVATDEQLTKGEKDIARKEIQSKREQLAQIFNTKYTEKTSEVLRAKRNE